MMRMKNKGLAILIAGLMMTTMIGTPKVVLAAEQVLMGRAGNFAVLAGQTITNSGPTTITGDVGVHPGTAFTELADVDLTGAVHLADAVALKAQTDLVTAYNQVAGMAEETLVSSELGGMTLKPGVYISESGVFQITGTLTLDAEGDPDAVFAFKTATTLITASASQVNMINGANPCNVYWKVGSSATLGPNSVFAGRILAHTSIALGTEAKVEGQLLAMNGSVTLLSNTITVSPCGYTPPVDVTGTKKWVGGTERPTIKLQLYRNGKAYLSPQDIVHPETTYTWPRLAKTDENGENYVYTVDEPAVPQDYSKSISEDGLTVTNTYSPLIDIKGEKTWVDNGGRPEKITVTLLRNGEVMDTKEVTAGNDGKWMYSFKGVTEFNAKGTPYTYTIKELAVPGYVTDINGFDIVNRRIQGVIEFYKHDGLNQGLAGAIIGLYATTDSGFDHPVMTATSGTNGKVTFTNVEYGSYQIREISAPAGYVKSKKALDVTIGKNGETVVPEPGILINEKISGSIIISNYDNEDKPLSGAEFTLFLGSVPVGKPKVTSAEGKITFVNVPFGTYTVKETKAPSGYVPTDSAKTVRIKTDGAAVKVTFSNTRTENDKGIPTLPETGESPRGPFILLGALFLAGGLLLLKKKSVLPRQG